MRVYPVSIIILGILIIFLLCDWKKGVIRYFQHVFFLYVGVVLFSNIGNFIEIGSFSLTNRAFLSIYTFFVALAVLFFDKLFDRRIMLAGIGLYVSVLIGYLSLTFMPYTGGVLHLLTNWDSYVYGGIQLDYELEFVFDFETLFKVIHFPVVLAVAFKALSKSQEKQYFLTKLLKISNYVLLYSVVELIAIKLFSIPISSIILRPLFGESEATFVYTERLQGLFKEASHYASAMFIWGLLNIFQIYISQHTDVRKTRIRIWCGIRFILILILLLASTSFVGILYCALLVIAALLYCTKINKSMLAVCIVLFGLIAIFMITNEGIMKSLGLESLYQRIYRTIETFVRLFNGETGTTSSEGARFTSIFSMLQILAQRPLFGVGAGITDAHSTLFATLGNLGLVGTALLAYMYVRFGNLKCNRISLFIIIIIYLSFTGSFGGIFDFQYPMIFFFAGLTFKDRKRSLKGTEANSFKKRTPIKSFCNN
mgnify:CR=1 FL=1